MILRFWVIIMIMSYIASNAVVSTMSPHTIPILLDKNMTNW